MNKREAILKDKILKYLNEIKKSESDSKIASEIGYEPFEVGFAGEQLSEDGLVTLMGITGPDSKNRTNEYMITLVTKGNYFFRHNSYISQYKSVIRKRNWIIAKTAAAIINALAIIVIACISLWINYINNLDKRTNQQLQERVNELEMQLKNVSDSVKSIQQDSIN